MTKGLKYDDGKLRFDLLPMKPVIEMVKVLTYGADKYSDENWRKVEPLRARYFAAALRHIIAWWEGEELDNESNLPHLAHAMCCIVFLMEGLNNDSN